MPGGSGTPLDLGASWIHGVGKGVGWEKKPQRWKDQWNPIYNIALKHSIETARTWKSEAEGAKGKTHCKDGSDYVDKKMWQMLEKIDDWIEDEKNNSLDDSKNLLEVVVTKVIKDLVKTDEDVKLADYILRYMFCMSLGVEPSKVSAKWLEQDYLFNGDEHVFPGGFS